MLQIILESQKMKLMRNESRLAMLSLSEAGAMPSLERALIVKTQSSLHISFKHLTCYFARQFSTRKYAGWKSGAWCYLCKYSTHLNYCGTAARSLGSEHSNLMFNLLAGSACARSMINPSKGGCLWGVTVLAELPLMDAHQAAVFGPTHWIHVLLCSPGPGQAPNARCGPALRHTSQAHFCACTYCCPLFKPSFWDH